MNRKKPVDDDFSAVEVYHTIFGFGSTTLLAKFLSTRAARFLEIRHPFEQYRFEPSTCAEYSRGIRVSRFVFPRIQGPTPITYLKDCIATLWSVIRSGQVFDLFVGVDCLNAATGLILKKAGLCRKVIFYAIDYSPRRFSSKILNQAYHLLERFVVNRVDAVWNASEILCKLNSSRGASSSLFVPPGIDWPVEAKPLGAIDRARLVYVGNLSREKGLDVAIRAMKPIVSIYPQASMIIIGTGSEEGALKVLVNDLGLSKQVIFAGRVPDNSQVRDILSKSGFGLATYAPIGYEPYAFPGKVIQYMSVGLPVVITSVPAFSKTISARGAGLVVQLDEQAIAEAVIGSIKDDELYARYRRNAIQLAKEYGFEAIYSDALSHVVPDFEGK
jgi:glycosyltransferase involved in cell wall biosynthesis